MDTKGKVQGKSGKQNIFCENFGVERLNWRSAGNFNFIKMCLSKSALTVSRMLLLCFLIT